jgi:GNAT superfamily N-acetyltransferase
MARRPADLLAIEPCTKRDFDQIYTDLADFWGSDRTRTAHHPIFVHELNQAAWVIRDHGTVVAYLFGFMSQDGQTGYCHLVAVRRSHQGRGLARQLYEYFGEWAASQGASRLKAITSPANDASIAFHHGLGFELQGEPDERGVHVVRNYGGPGVDRVVFLKPLSGPSRQEDA